MIPPIHFAAPPSANVPEESPAPPLGAGRDTSFAFGATHRLLTQPFIVDDLSDEESPVFVATPLQYLRFDRDSGCCVDAPVHSKPSKVQ